jgi:hypothetical protein
VSRRRLATAAAIMLVAAGLAVAGLASAQGGPFYLVPSPTHECHAVKNCEGVVGPWVVVPANGQATYLFGCRTKINYIIGGTDARASSTSVRVWWDARLGSPVSLPPASVQAGPELLWHAVADNHKQGWFQPVLGCVSLIQKSKRATVSAVPGSPPASPVDLHANKVILSIGGRRTLSVRCKASEKLVDSWSALAFGSTGPPANVYANGVKIRTRVVGNQVEAAFTVDNFVVAPLAPVSSVQVGAICQPKT